MTNATVNIATDVLRAMNHFPVLSDINYNERTGAYVKNGHKQVEDYQNWVANGFGRYLATGDISHLNNMVAGSLALGRYRTLVRVTKSLACHKFDSKNKKYIGKIDAEKRDKLTKIHPDSGLEQWEFSMKEFFEKEGEHAEKAPAKDWSVESAVAQLIKQATKHEADTNDLAKEFAKQIKLVAKSDTVRKLPDVLSEATGEDFGLVVVEASTLDAPDVIGFLVPTKDPDTGAKAA